MSLDLLDQLIDSDSFGAVGFYHFEKNVEERPVFLILSHLSLQKGSHFGYEYFLLFNDSNGRSIGGWQEAISGFHYFAFYGGPLLHPHGDQGDDLEESDSDGVDVRGVFELP